MSKPSKVAVVGAGFSGLATAWYLVKRNFQVTLFDSPQDNSKASAIAAGLLHYYSGQHAKYNRQGEESHAETSQLLEIASEALGEKVFEASKLIRPALNESQKADFQLAASLYQDIKWLTAAECQNCVPGMIDKPGIMVESALTVYTDLYLKGLAQAFQKSQGEVLQKQIDNLKELEGFNHVVLAPGNGLFTLTPSCSMPLGRVKGQILEFEWPKDLPPLSYPLNSQAYIVMSRDRTKCFVGATFERQFFTTSPQIEVAVSDILPKAVALFPPIEKMRLLNCRAAVRVTGPQHLPYITQIDARTSVITGMGSKGLLYHAAYAKKLVERISIA